MSGFRTLSQLRNMTWPDQDAAIKELKRSGLKAVGSDYQLGEEKPGLWMLLDRTDDAHLNATLDREEKAKVKVTKLPERKARGIKSSPQRTGPKPGKESLPKAKPPHAGDVAMKQAAAKALGYDIHFRISPTKKLNEQAATLAEAKAIAARMNAEHGKHGRRAMIYAKQAKGPSVPVTDDDPKPAEFGARINGGNANPTPEPERTNDLSGLPAEAGPYGLRVGEPVAQHSIAQTALQWSRKIGFVVAITDKAGKVVRVIDGRLGGKRPTRTATRVGERAARAPKGEGKMARATALLMRKEGATAKEISDATGWPTGQRHINKLAKLSGSTIKSLGNQHWRLIKE